MKFSAAVALGLAPIALAKSIHNVYPVKRDGHKNKQVIGGVTNGAGQVIQQPGQGGNTIVVQPGAQLLIIWQNPGGGAATTTVNPQPAATQPVAGQPAAGQPAAGTPVVGAPAAQQTHSVVVGGAAGLVFSPPEVKANVGDMVIFTFMSQNHTVTQSPFDTPCKRLEGGMDTGFQANPNNTISPPPQVAMQVMVATPLWFYCRAGPHCGKGMVMSINPTAEKTQAMFQSLAIAQNGTGAGGAITGNPGQGAPAPNPAAGAGGAASSGAASSSAVLETPTAVNGAASSTGLAELPAQTGVAGGATNPNPANGIVAGVGTVLPDGACACSCACIDSGFPGGTGSGSIGGAGGAIPAAMLAVR